MIERTQELFSRVGLVGSPVDPFGYRQQWVREVDDLIESGPENILLPLVTRPAISRMRTASSKRRPTTVSLHTRVSQIEIDCRIQEVLDLLCGLTRADAATGSIAGASSKDAFESFFTGVVGESGDAG